MGGYIFVSMSYRASHRKFHRGRLWRMNIHSHGPEQKFRCKKGHKRLQRIGSTENITLENYLKEIYYNPANSGNFSGTDKLYRYVRKAMKYVISKHRIRQRLQRQEAYNLQRPVRRHFKQNRVITIGIDDQWDADLMGMSKYSKDNDKYAYVLVVIDIFSKYVRLRPLREKMGWHVGRVFAEISTPNG